MAPSKRNVSQIHVYLTLRYLMSNVTMNPRNDYILVTFDLDL